MDSAYKSFRNTRFNEAPIRESGKLKAKEDGER